MRVAEEAGQLRRDEEAEEVVRRVVRARLDRRIVCEEEAALDGGGE